MLKDDEFFQFQLGQVTLLTRRTDNWIQLEEDIHTHQIVAIWMGGPGRDIGHYVDLPVKLVPDIRIDIFWDPDRLMIAEPVLQNDFPNMYRRKTLILKQYERGGSN